MVEQACTLHLCLTDVPLASALAALMAPDEIRASLRLQLTVAILRFKEGDLEAGRYELERARSLRARLDGTGIGETLDRDLTVMVLLRYIYQDEPVSADDLTRLERIAEDEPDGSWLRGLTYIMRCLIYLRRGQLEVAKTAIFQAIRNLREGESLYARMFAHLHHGTVAFWQGRSIEAHNVLRIAEEMAFEHFPGNASVLALAQILMAEIAYDQNDVTHATELLRENMRVLETSEVWSEIYLSGYSASCGIAVAAGDEASATTHFAQAMAVAVDKGMTRLSECALSQRISFLALRGKLQEAEHMSTADMLAPPCETDGRTWREREDVARALARLAIAKGKAGQALDLLNPLLAAAEEQDRRRSILQLQLLRAVALHAVGAEANAIDIILLVIEWAAIEGIVRLFVDEGPRMAALLRTVLMANANGPAISTASTRHIERLLATFSGVRRGQESERLRSLLTARETQILHELARGAANKVIAHRLDISEDGIKFHLKSIYRKLGVSSRVMALMVAQKLGLLGRQ